MFERIDPAVVDRRADDGDGSRSRLGGGKSTASAIDNVRGLVKFLPGSAGLPELDVAVGKYKLIRSEFDLSNSIYCLFAAALSAFQVCHEEFKALVNKFLLDKRLEEGYIAGMSEDDFVFSDGKKI